MTTPTKGPSAFAGFLLLDVVVPLAAYYVFRALGASIWIALIAGTVLPMLRLGISLILRRRPSPAALFTLALLTIGTLIGLMTADARLLMARESYLTGVVGVWILLSLLWPRPFVFTATIGFMPQTAAEEWHRSWEASGKFRKAMRGMTWAFGLAFLIDSAARVVMSYTLPLDLVPVASIALLAIMLVAIVQAGKTWGRRQQPQATDVPR